MGGVGLFQQHGQVVLAAWVVLCRGEGVVLQGLFSVLLPFLMVKADAIGRVWVGDIDCLGGAGLFGGCGRWSGLMFVFGSLGLFLLFSFLATNDGSSARGGCRWSLSVDHIVVKSHRLFNCTIYRLHPSQFGAI